MRPRATRSGEFVSTCHLLFDEMIAARSGHRQIKLHVLPKGMRATRTHRTNGPRANYAPHFFTPSERALLQRQENYCRVKLATATELVEYPPVEAMACTFTAPAWVSENGP